MRRKSKHGDEGDREYGDRQERAGDSQPTVKIGAVRGNQ